MAFCVFQMFWILLIQLWLSPPIISNADGNDTGCFPSILVPRNTVWKACVMNSLEINCTIFSELHCSGLDFFNVTWCRIDNENKCRHVKHSTNTKWIIINERKMMTFLKFQNISMQDAGLYRCEIQSNTPSVSHAINVTVTENVSHCSTASVNSSQENNTNILNPKVKNSTSFESYVYISIGVGVLIFTVFVVTLIIIRCREQKKSIKTIHENQSTATPVANCPPPVYPRMSSCKSQTLPAQIGPPPSCTYDTPPVRVRSLRDRLPAGERPVSRTPPRRCRDKDPGVKIKEENPLIYATLNHEAVPQRPARVAHVQIEASEYAAVKTT